MMPHPAEDAPEGDAGFQAMNGLSLAAQWAFWEAFKAITPKTVGIPFSRFRESVDEAFGPGCWEALASSESAYGKEPESGRFAALLKADKPFHPREWGGFLTDISIVKASLLQRPETHDRDLEILAAGVKWRLFSGKVKALLANRARAVGRGWEEEKIQLLRIGLRSASGHMDVPQTIRLGEKWVVDGGGKTMMVRPNQLTILERIRWFHAAACAAAKAALEGEPWPERPRNRKKSLNETVPLDDSIFFQEVRRTALDELVFSEELKMALELLSGTQFTDADRDLFEAVFTTGSWLEAGKVLGLRPATTRKRKERFLKKLRPHRGDLSPL